MADLKKLRSGRESNYGALVEDESPRESPENPLNMERQSRLRGARNRLLFAMTLCILLLLAEVVGSILSGSLAVLADAGHLLTDVATYAISLISIWLAKRPTSEKFTYGWLRAEVLGALFSVILSLGLAVVLTYFAVKRIIEKDYDIDGEVMLIISVINFVGNIIQILQLQCGLCCFESMEGEGRSGLHHANGHGHSHGPLTAEGAEDHMNVRAACLHILGDSLFGFGLLIGSLIIYLQPTLKIVDPILTIIFGVIVLFTLIGIVRDSTNILMEGKPRHIDFDDVRRRLVEIDGVEGVHSLRIWSMTSDIQLVTVHLVLARLYDGQPVQVSKILPDARHILETKFNLIHSTIQIETADNGVDFLCARSG
ncbi:proton-coupled zinc antiporter SLC30A2-like [Diadema antillarum]|uniref:proton-coupled zinc antiporter SLC30A2-like n=1 Tax=Diadema antillarum TaxID=105358 RepID=UPI003A848ACE